MSSGPTNGPLVSITGAYPSNLLYEPKEIGYLSAKSDVGSRRCLGHFRSHPLAHTLSTSLIMKCKFVVGQKVVCINANRNCFRLPGYKYREDDLWVTKGLIYTIREIKPHYLTGEPNLLLVEIIRPPLPADKFGEVGFNYQRFKPLESRKTDISMFKEMLGRTDTENLKHLKELI